MNSKLEVLKRLEIGERVAEEESDNLEKYFVETDQWQQMWDGNIDVVYGPKGSGKSALYTLLNKKEDSLFDNGVLIASGENLRGATVFRSIVTDPPPTEMAFIYLWKLYCLSLIGRALRDYDIKNEDARSLVKSLETAKLLPTSDKLSVIFRAVTTYLKNWLNRDARSIEYAVNIDPSTGAATVSRKTEFGDSTDDKNLGDIPVDDLLNIADAAMQNEDLTLWILFDRLDVAFAESQELERNALRALFRAYNDIKAYSNIALKIFVRDDIWKRITQGGFTEASHITKSVHISWTEESLLNLIVLRLINSPNLIDYLGINPNAIKSDYEKQHEMLYRLIPDQVDTGKNPKTFNWIVSRTTDSTKNSVPREVIHLIDEAKGIPIQKLERGSEEPGNEFLFDRSSLKEALTKVSKIRYEQTLLAEYPDILPYLEKLEGEKCEHTINSLSRFWELDISQATTIAKKLTEIGFFEWRGSKENPSFWVPFLYRGALKLVQGKSV